MALLTFIDKVIQAIENGEHAIGVFLDFSKAFDTVDHKIKADEGLLSVEFNQIL